MLLTRWVICAESGVRLDEIDPDAPTKLREWRLKYRLICVVTPKEFHKTLVEALDSGARDVRGVSLISSADTKVVLSNGFSAEHTRRLRLRTMSQAQLPDLAIELIQPDNAVLACWLVSKRTEVVACAPAGAGDECASEYHDAFLEWVSLAMDGEDIDLLDEIYAG